MDSAERHAVEHFVRRTLGCQCPDEVFQSLEIGPVSMPDAASPITRLVVGNRLLVYLVDAGDRGAGDLAIEMLVAAGRRDRDQHGFNRFRLAIASNGPTRLEPAVQQQLASAPVADDRAHLHVLARREVPEVLRPDRAGR